MVSHVYVDLLEGSHKDTTSRLQHDILNCMQTHTHIYIYCIYTHTLATPAFFLVATAMISELFDGMIHLIFKRHLAVV